MPDAVLGMGFGFAEIGTVTPLPQAGNPRPRVFRLIEDGALINRLGFNNGGHAAALARLQARRAAGVVGVNVGANKDAADRAADYAAGVRLFADVASLFHDQRLLAQHAGPARPAGAGRARRSAGARSGGARRELVAAGKPRRPIVVKLAPDIAEDDLEPIVRVLVARGVDGIAVSNTTLARNGRERCPAMRRRPAACPARRCSTARPSCWRACTLLTEGRIPLIGIGGIDSGAAAIAKIEAGATLLQLYTGLVFHGPGLLARIKRDLVAYAERHSSRASPTPPAARPSLGRQAADG